GLGVSGMGKLLFQNTKHQTPNTKETPNSKLQKNLSAPFDAGRRKLGAYLVFGVWCLVFHQCCPPFPFTNGLCGSACGVTPLTSETAIIGRKRMNNRKHVKNNPNVPMNVQMSTHVGR